MEKSNKIIITVALVAALIVIIGVYALLNSALAPLDHTEIITTIDSTSSVDIQATTFNGDIIVQPYAGQTIEVDIKIQAPKGHLTDVDASTVNQTENGVTKVIALAEMNVAFQVNHRATIIIKLPQESQYNLTLSTLNGNIIKPLLNDLIVKATTSNGKIDINDDNAISINASSLNGDVNVELSQGTLFRVDASTANGRVTYQGIAMNTSIQTETYLNGVTSSGAGKLALILSTANGNITVEYSQD